MKTLILSLITCLSASSLALAQEAKIEHKAPEKAWYEKMSIKGYAQVRYNRVAESNAKLTCQQCDKSIGNKQGVFVRRARGAAAESTDERPTTPPTPPLAPAPARTTSRSGTPILITI